MLHVNHNIHRDDPLVKPENTIIFVDFSIAGLTIGGTGIYYRERRRGILSRNPAECIDF